MRKNFLLAEKFWKFWGYVLDSLNSENACIIVEGEHDRKVLMNLYVPRDRVITTGDKPCQRIVEQVLDSFSKVYIFMDLDEGGSRKAGKLISLLSSVGISVVNLWGLFMRFLGRFGFKSVRKVEELKKFSVYLPKSNKLILRKIRRDIGTIV